MSAVVQHDPHKTSFYVTDELYEELIADFSNWQRDELAIAQRAGGSRAVEHGASARPEQRRELPRKCPRHGARGIHRSAGDV